MKRRNCRYSDCQFSATSTANDAPYRATAAVMAPHASAAATGWDGCSVEAKTASATNAALRLAMAVMCDHRSRRVTGGR
jgi:hypothetical protein